MLQPQELQEVEVLVLSVKMADEQVECLLSARNGHTCQQLWVQTLNAIVS